MLYQVQTIAFALKHCDLVRYKRDFTVYNKLFPSMSIY